MKASILLLSLLALPAFARDVPPEVTVPPKIVTPPPPCVKTAIKPWYNAPQDRKATCLPTPETRFAPAGVRGDQHRAESGKGTGVGFVVYECKQARLNRKASVWTKVSQECKKK